MSTSSHFRRFSCALAWPRLGAEACHPKIWFRRAVQKCISASLSFLQICVFLADHGGDPIPEVDFSTVARIAQHRPLERGPPHDRPKKRKSVRKTISQKCIFGPPSETKFWDGRPRRPGAARPEHRKNVESVMRSTNSRDFTRVSPGSALSGGTPSHAQQGFH